MDRIRSLDSLRGIAALVVVFYHFSLVDPILGERVHSIPPLRVATAGPAAVYVFFVLSGLVLYLSLDHHERSSWLAFAVRRLVRLYPPVIISVLISTALFLLIDPLSAPFLPGWITRFSWMEAPNPRLLAGHFLLLDPDRFHALNNPMWSLVVEVRLSLLFPLLAAAMRRSSVLTMAGCAAVSLVSRVVLASGHQIWLVDPFMTLQFLDLFALGALMARHRTLVIQTVTRIPALLVASLIIASLIGYGRYPPYVMYVSAFALVAASLTYHSLGRLYSLKPLVWLGERSFSLYLIHVPLLLAIVHGFAGKMPIGFILVAALAACLVGAELFWLFIERPAITASRSAGRRIAGL